MILTIDSPAVIILDNVGKGDPKRRVLPIFLQY